MSLSRQLVLIIFVLFLVVFAGTLAISVNNTRVYLSEQMQSHAQDTATSLALSITPAMTHRDWPMINSMVDAIFDRGYYRELAIVSIDGKTLLKRELPVTIEGVPQWFVRLIPLETPTGEALISTGWRQAGKLVIRSHPGYAYHELWRSSVGTFWWFFGSWVAAMLLVVGVLRFALAPLREIERQALAISNREFPILERLPWTRELRRVVLAMNKMTAKIKRILSDQVELTEKMREEAYRDPVTGLANRRYFDSRMGYLLAAPEEFPHGALLLAELADFRTYNEHHGYEGGDELLRQAGHLLEQMCQDARTHLVARLGGADFAILATLETPDEADALAEKISRELAQLRLQGLADTPCTGHLGVAWFDAGQSASDLFSEADMALRAAQGKGPNAWHRYQRTALEKQEVHGAARWHDLLQQAIDRGSITLFSQPVVSCADGRPLHREIFARIAGEDGRMLPAGVFMPMAERLGLVGALDRLVVEAVLARLRISPEPAEIFSVNISPTSVHDPAFTAWLCGLLRRSPGLAGRLIFEATEYGCAAKPDALHHFVDNLRAVGSQFCLDHFGVGFVSFGYLRDLKLDYIKIDGSSIRRLDRNKDNQFFVHALAEIAHGLDIQVIAEAVEDQREWDALKGLRIDGVQGYLLGEPALLQPPRTSS